MLTAESTAERRSDHPVAKPECTQQDVQPVWVYGTCANVKSVSQLRIVAPEPAKETTIRERVGAKATKPFMLVVVVSLLSGIRQFIVLGVSDYLRAAELLQRCHVFGFDQGTGVVWARYESVGS